MCTLHDSFSLHYCNLSLDWASCEMHAFVHKILGILSDMVKVFQ